MICGRGEELDILEEYNPKMKRYDTNEEIDLIPFITTSYYDEKYNVIGFGLEYDRVEAEIWLEKDGKKITWQGEFHMGPQ